MRLGAATFRGSGGGGGIDPFKLVVVVVGGEEDGWTLEDMGIVFEFVEGGWVIATGAILPI